jgi:hypothetical protein
MKPRILVDDDPHFTEVEAILRERLGRDALPEAALAASEGVAS